MRAMVCSSCELSIDHCHGTLVLHAGQMAECTEEDCLDFDHTRHAFVVDCFDVAGGCACSEPAMRAAGRPA